LSALRRSGAIARAVKRIARLAEGGLSAEEHGQSEQMIPELASRHFNLPQDKAVPEGRLTHSGRGAIQD
jgi:hypothetical protein